MGIFQNRAEEPDEWAGLPAEPWQPRLPGEMLPPSVGDLTSLGTTGLSLSIPTEILEAAPETVAETVDDGGDGD